MESHELCKLILRGCFEKFSEWKWINVVYDQSKHFIFQHSLLQYQYTRPENFPVILTHSCDDLPESLQSRYIRTAASWKRLPVFFFKQMEVKRCKIRKWKWIFQHFIPQVLSFSINQYDSLTRNQSWCCS